jgi:hypothetical protein
MGRRPNRIGPCRMSPRIVIAVDGFRRLPPCAGAPARIGTGQRRGSQGGAPDLFGIPRRASPGAFQAIPPVAPAEDWSARGCRLPMPPGCRQTQLLHSSGMAEENIRLVRSNGVPSELLRLELIFVANRMWGHASAYAEHGCSDPCPRSYRGSEAHSLRQPVVLRSLPTLRSGCFSRHPRAPSGAWHLPLSPRRSTVHCGSS